MLHSFGAGHDPGTVECGGRYLMSRYSGSGLQARAASDPSRSFKIKEEAPTWALFLLTEPTSQPVMIFVKVG